MTAEQGDIYIADLGDEIRHRVMVLSYARFATASGRVLIAPWIAVDEDEVLDPWRIRLGDEAVALDLMRTVWTERLLTRVDRAPAAVVERARRVIRHLT